jgi:hypothetical protein
LPGAGLVRTLWPRDAYAAATWCGQDKDDKTEGGINILNYIDVWTDPACGGNRYVAYDYYTSASQVVDTIFIDYIRAWICGGGAPVLDIEDQTANQVDGSNYWSEWTSTPNTCGFQSDQRARFIEGVVLDEWTYSNW